MVVRRQPLVSTLAVPLRLTVVTGFALSSGLTETLLYHSDPAFKQDYKSRKFCHLSSGLTLAVILVENGIFPFERE